jgi:hypothetical protein
VCLCTRQRVKNPKKDIIKVDFNYPTQVPTFCVLVFM